MNDINRMSDHIRNFPDGDCIEDEHRCAKMSDVYHTEFENVVIVKKRSIWYLLFDRYADQTAVDEGRADEIGEVITEGIETTYIKYCPYCGIDLGGKKIK